MLPILNALVYRAANTFFLARVLTMDYIRKSCWCTAAPVPPPFRPGDPALCGSHPL